MVEEIENPQTLSTEAVTTKLREIQAKIKELTLHEKTYKEQLIREVTDLGGEFKGEIYSVKLSETNRLDEDKVVKFCLDKKIDPVSFSKMSFDSIKIKDYMKKNDLAYSLVTSPTENKRLNISIIK